MYIQIQIRLRDVMAHLIDTNLRLQKSNKLLILNKYKLHSSYQI